MILQAKDLDFSIVRRCPKCNIGVLPYGRHEPFVVNPEGEIYCRRHGEEVEQGYAERLSEYRTQHMKQRRKALEALAKDDDEIDEADNAA